jgi:hypothetical protein
MRQNPSVAVIPKESSAPKSHKIATLFTSLRAAAQFSSQLTPSGVASAVVLLGAAMMILQSQ